MKKEFSLDKLDLKILRLLQEDGKMSNVDLASKVGLTPPTTLERVKKLQNANFIEKYQAILNKKKLGRAITCFIAFTLKDHGKEKSYERIQEGLIKIAGVEEIHLVTGAHDYLVKINLKDIDDLKNFVVNELSMIQDLDKIETFITISSKINPSPVPLS